MTENVSPEMESRLRNLEAFAGLVADWAGNAGLHVAARHMLLQPAAAAVDPDLVEARKAAATFLDAHPNEVFAGGWDSHPIVEAALAAIKRVRKLGASA